MCMNLEEFVGKVPPTSVLWPFFKDKHLCPNCCKNTQPLTQRTKASSLNFKIFFFLPQKATWWFRSTTMIGS